LYGCVDFEHIEEVIDDKKALITKIGSLFKEVAFDFNSP